MKYRVEFNTTISVYVDIEAPDEDAAGENAWDVAEEYLETVYGNNRDVTASATLDGVGADSIEETA